MSQNEIESAERPTSIQPILSASSFEPTTSSAESNLTFFKRQKYCDVTFCVGEAKQEIKCHKMFLMSRSDVFETMFSGRWENSSINLPDTEPEVFLLFLEFIYGDKFTSATRAMAVKLLELGHKYNVKALVKNCEDCLSQDLKVEDCFEMFKLARHYSLKGLMEKAGNLMASSFTQYSDNATFLEMDEGALIYLLQRNDLAVDEIDIFTSVLRWALDSMGKNRSYADVLKNIIPFIRFPLLTAQEFANHVVPLQILPQKDVLNLFLYLNSQGSVRVDAARSLKFSTTPRQGQKVTLELYEIADLQNRLRSIQDICTHSSLIEDVESEDILEITLNPGSGFPYPKLKLASLMLQGINYDLLQSKWPLGRDPGSTFRIKVGINVIKLSPSRAFCNHFNTECVISKGRETEIVVEPRLEFQPDVKYHIAVKFQKFLSIMSDNGNSSSLTYDVLTTSNLKSTLAHSAIKGTLNVNMVPKSYKRVPRSLHLVRGLKFIVD